MSAETENTAVTCGECKFMFFGLDAVKQFIDHPCMTKGLDQILPGLGFDAAKPEPPPLANDRAAIQDLVVADVLSRKAKGIKEYGTPLQAFNGRDALNDLYQELLDAIFYLRQAIEERDTLVEAHAVVDDGCSCGCTAAVNCGKDGCPHEQP